jgi:hypothetical protein
MKKLMLLFFAFLFFLSAYKTYCQSPNWQWVKVIEGTAFEGRIGHAIIDNDNNTIIVGGFRGGVAVFDTIGISFNYNENFIAKIDDSGNWVWAVKANVLSIAHDTQGNIYFTAVTNDSTWFGNTFIDSAGYVIGKINAQGEFTWAKKISLGNSASYASITLDNLDNIYLSGRFNSIGKDFIARLNLQGDMIWQKEYDGFGSKIYEITPNKFVISGTSYSGAYFDTIPFPAFGGEDVFVAAFDSNGVWQWVKGAGGVDLDRCSSPTLDNNGNIYITGYFENAATFGATSLTAAGGSKDVFVSKLDANGNWLWAKNAGGLADDRCSSIVSDNNGNIYITGQFALTASFGSTNITSNGNDDIFISKLDNQGNFIWTINGGSSDEDGGDEIWLDKNGDLLIAGYISANATFGNLNIPFTNTTGMFIGKLSSTVNIQKKHSFNSYFHFYPNPTSHHLNITTTRQGNEGIQYQIINTLGATVAANKATAKDFSIDVSTLPTGIYFIHLQSGNAKTVKRFVKE